MTYRKFTEAPYWDLSDGMTSAAHDVGLREVCEEEGVEAIILASTSVRSVGCQSSNHREERLEFKDISKKKTKIIRVQLGIPKSQKCGQKGHEECW